MKANIIKIIIFVALSGFLYFLSGCATQHKIKFYNSPCLVPYKNERFSLCDDLKIKINKKKYIVPRGFKTDFASIPRVFRSFYSPNNTDTIPASILHDYLYSCPGSLSRREIDSIFYDSLVLSGNSKFLSYKYWLSVRIAGKKFFNAGMKCYLND